MSKTRCILVVFAFLFTLEQTAWGQAQQHWRYWTQLDGLGESFCASVTVSPSGNIWVNHGSVEQMSWLDGYSVHHIPSPGPNVPVYESSSGQIWSLYWDELWVRIGGLQQYKYTDRRWVRYEADECQPVRSRYEILPVAQDRVLFLLPDRVMEFNAATKQTTVIKNVNETKLERFNHMISARDGGVWITGEKGAAKIRGEDGIFSSAPDWVEYLFDEDLGVHNLRFPFEEENGELFATAVILKDSNDTVVHFDGSSWEMLYIAGDENIVGLPGADNSFWVSSGLWNPFSLARIENKREEFVEKTKVLSGRLCSVTIEPKGVFWLRTSQGLARYAPSAWRTPGEVTQIDKVCHAIHEDGEGRIWFACQDTIVLFHDGQWKTYSMTRMTYRTSTISLCSLPDGRIAMRTGFPDEFLTFNVRTEIFERVRHGEGRRTGLIAPRKDGNIWIETFADNKVRLEIYDGKLFQTFLEREDNWDIGEFRYLVEAEDGALWLGGVGPYGLARYKDGKYETFDSDDEYPGGGAFCILDVGDGKIWFGGRGTIFQFDGESFTVVRSGLESIRSMITSRDGSIWVASGTGVHRFHNRSWVTNSAEDGLPDAAVYEVFEDSRGRIWAGTTQGISLYHPEADEDAPQTIIPRDKNVRQIAPGGEAQFVYTGMDKWKYTEVDRLLYSHRIDDGESSPFTSDTVAIFSGLSPGPHRFEVRAMDRNWNVDPTPDSFEFTVLLPWYKEPAFLVIAITGAILILLFAGYAINRHINLRLSYETLRRTQRQLIQSEKMAALG